MCGQLSAAGHDVIEADVVGKPAVDLLDAAAVAASVRGADAIVHCAGIPSPEGVEPVDLLRINTVTTFNALEQAWRAGVRTAVLASSGSIHGTAWGPPDMRPAYVPVDESSPLDYVDPYALSKDVLERTGAMYARRGMTVTALRFHWILTPEEVRDLVAAAPEADGTKNLWGYVDREDAARACLLALTPHRRGTRFHVLQIAAADTVVTRPTTELLDTHLPDVERRASVEGTTGLFDCSRAADVIGWAAEGRWRHL